MRSKTGGRCERFSRKGRLFVLLLQFEGLTGAFFAVLPPCIWFGILSVMDVLQVKALRYFEGKAEKLHVILCPLPA